MQLNTLKPKHEAKAKRPRVGRGGKRGTTAGKGTKGQKARSGHRIRPAMREYIQRLPKLRGYANKSTQDVPTLITIEKLSALKQTAISRKALVEAKMIRSEGERVKILGNGEITKAITVEGVPMSASAKAKIEKAGGSVK
jgi:large subunit ribosomal protein L15